ncbi:MAG: lysophospholipid acyltransferase family protein [Roseomonas sp.]|nr:lysophospholipid acyltransferase family protein [Roseomonas sp.]MCA3428106.1 lysophospholipid acyltransferase family protein [Roseomonas sp.]MCA3433586.1 lysophospholipid acyltransferase family protein [Roseomonas sp.]
MMPQRPKHEEIFEIFMVQLLRCMPITWASWLGGWLGARQGRGAIKADRLWVQRLRKNLARFCNVTDPAELDRRIIAFTERIGSFYAEYPNLQRLYASGRVELVGAENLDAAGRPFILLGCHIANWELIGALAKRWGGSAVLYLPLGGGLREKIALEARKAWPDLELIPASPDAMLGIDAVLQLDRAVTEGKNLAIFVDEERQGYVWAPSLGRSLPYAGNRWIAARLAVRHNINIIPAFVERLGPARYRIVIQPILEKPQGKSGQALAQHLADQIDARVEAWVRPRIENWYWLPYFDADLPCPMDQKAKSSDKANQESA